MFKGDRRAGGENTSAHLDWTGLVSISTYVLYLTDICYLQTLWTSVVFLLLYLDNRKETRKTWSTSLWILFFHAIFWLPPGTKSPRRRNADWRYLFFRQGDRFATTVIYLYVFVQETLTQCFTAHSVTCAEESASPQRSHPSHWSLSGSPPEGHTLISHSSGKNIQHLNVSQIQTYRSSQVWILQYVNLLSPPGLFRPVWLLSDCSSSVWRFSA